MTDLETQRISELRAKVLAGTISREEQIEAIRLLRSGRATAVASSGKPASGSRAKKAAISSDDLLSQLEGL